MKAFAKLALVGFSGVVALKLFTTILLPLLGMLIGLLGLTVKLALIAAVVFFIYEMLRKRRENDEPEVEVGTIDVEVEIEDVQPEGNGEES